MENWINLIVSLCSGLAVCIPLVVKLIRFVQKAIREKNWSAVMSLVLKLMTEAEQNYKLGSEKKKYVMDSIESIKSSLNYDVDMEVVSTMIDSICDASKVINSNK